ncbi:MAG TPA: UDP-N-acetylmuramoyl-L-alanyl-D-glutamate--2,6-diaminopimelate ligase [Polyangiaceae bacterium]|jgi:UDP-N-acetylmuramoyl-L-alanyl-D-glutamate--2,6-diaminopimelate ligase|nr:UDP-N-acetylmuramoyl-L-alanyl-D-glutamate--2,6-diaminopimelate ligase [Polyangiaceae bacterium]
MNPKPTLHELASELQRHLPELVGEANPTLLDVCQDSRDVAPGALFVARTGAAFDGSRFISDAIGRGAVAVMQSKGSAAAPNSVANLLVDDAQNALPFAAEFVQGHPSRELGLVGITGTNGKTTTAALLTQCLERLGQPTATIGTLGLAFAGEEYDTGLTTAPSDVVSRFLRRVRDQGATHAAMEVSSHALDQGRVDALSFRVAAFSNLTQDHLDYHKTIEAYAEAKARLFTALSPGRSVINRVDAFGRVLLERLKDNALAVGRDEQSEIRLLDSRLSALGTSLHVDTPAGPLAFETELVGEHNVDNWLLVLGILYALGQPLNDVARFAHEVVAAPGRMQRCQVPGSDVTVIVDYAHTPDALERALHASRALVPAGAKLVCVFGCGGDRDNGKRPKMGECAARLADFSIVTNDNPRSEEPSTIAEQIEAGMSHARGSYSRCLDRSLAIAEAISRARSGDVILIAGKGHENYQIIGKTRHDFDDRLVATRCLQQRLLERG